jgi:internalin A
VKPSLVLLGIVWACGTSGCSPASPPADPAGVSPGGERSAEYAPASALAGRPETERADDADPPGVSPGRPSPDEPIRTLEQLIAALKQKNPGFDDQNLAMQPIDADLLYVVINDPAINDISPLRRQRIGALDLRNCDLTDLSALEGLPIVELYLEDNQRLRDLSPLRGMPLQKLYLSNTAVENLGPLRGAPLIELNAIGTSVRDLGPLSQSPLQLLWLTDCPVTDVAPLKSMPLISLTLENAPVEDLGPLAGSPIQRLHIGGTAVTDLTPVAQMRLSRLIFTPGRIKTGLQAVRNSASIREIGTDLDNRLPPAEFWQRYDQGNQQD